MKKIIAALALVCVVAGGAFGQTGLLDVNKYFSYFPIKTNEKVSDNDYVWSSDEADYERFMTLSGKDNYIDTPLEFALLSYYSQPVLKIRPKEADALLPANNPKLADQKLGAAVFQEIQVLRFLGDTAAVNRHEAVLQFITDRKNVTRAEIETYYRNNIGKLVSDIVDEQLARFRNEGRRINANAKALSDVKSAITEFMLAPSEATYRNLLLTYNRGDFDGSGLVLGYAMVEINPEISRALANNKVLTGAR